MGRGRGLDTYESLTAVCLPVPMEEKALMPFQGLTALRYLGSVPLSKKSLSDPWASLAPSSSDSTMGPTGMEMGGSSADIMLRASMVQRQGGDGRQVSPHPL